MSFQILNKSSIREVKFNKLHHCAENFIVTARSGKVWFEFHSRNFLNQSLVRQNRYGPRSGQILRYCKSSQESVVVLN